MKTKKSLSRLLRNYRKTHDALMAVFDKICAQAISEYNNNERNFTKIKECRIHTSNWHPDQKVIDVDVQSWIEGSCEGGWQNMYAAESTRVSDTFKSILDKHLPRQRGFEFKSYVQNVLIEND